MRTFKATLLALMAGITLFSCSEDYDEPRPTLSQTELTLFVGESQTITYSHGNCEWSSDLPLVASVENGTITAEHAGTTIIRANECECKVTVRSHYYYFEPYTGWYYGPTYVKNYMKDYTLEVTDAGDLCYRGKGDVFAYVYIFSDNHLIGSTMVVRLSDTNFVKFLTESYHIIPINNDKDDFYLCMISPDMKTAVGLKIGNYYTAIYIPYPADKKRLSDGELKELIKEEFERQAGKDITAGLLR